MNKLTKNDTVELVNPTSLFCSLFWVFINLLTVILCVRTQSRELFCKEKFLKKFSKFIGKHLCQSLRHRCFPVNFAKNFKNTFFYRTTPLVASLCNSISQFF